jgi:uncharacterized protein YlzI (FlbEa/FlbD family)
MARTHEFTKNEDSTKITIVLDKIETIARDEFSDCTSITLKSGRKIGVSETVSEVTRVVNGSAT